MAIRGFSESSDGNELYLEVGGEPKLVGTTLAEDQWVCKTSKKIAAFCAIAFFIYLFSTKLWEMISGSPISFLLNDNYLYARETATVRAALILMLAALSALFASILELVIYIGSLFVCTIIEMKRDGTFRTIREARR
ncbi:MAG: hypothetical protein Q8P49_03030 [Candidatus Liptonbacteria bacterium]|nr:hypothetical protein [Candidatus Liptonbacteria bacterium]